MACPCFQFCLPTTPSVPPAPRPTWLRKKGPGQANTDPLYWAISLEQWLFFVKECGRTETWKALKSRKGEDQITMYDLNEHFVIPWTAGTGSSIALLMNATPLKVHLMISHAWAGSVIESYGAFYRRALKEDYLFPEVPMFFCTFSMYQPEDGAGEGLSIKQQLDLEPFMKIIASRPPNGMCVLHTTIYEVYRRLWTVHEVDEGVLAQIPMRGLCNFESFQETHFGNALQINTSTAECRPEDKEMLERQIIKRGGYERLDRVITDFRLQMQQHFEDYWTHSFEYKGVDGKRFIRRHSCSNVNHLQTVQEQEKDIWDDRFEVLEAMLPSWMDEMCTK